MSEIASGLFNVAPFRSALFPVSAIVVWTNPHPTADAWTIQYVLYKERGGDAEAHPGAPEPPSGPTRLWDWAVAGLDDGDTGNGLDFAYTAFDTDEMDAIDGILEILTDEGRADPDVLQIGVLPGILIGRGARSNTQQLDVLLIRDDRDRLHVLPTDLLRIDRYRVGVGYLSSLRWTRFRTTRFPKLDKAEGWRLDRTYECHIRYGNSHLEFSVASI